MDAYEEVRSYGHIHFVSLIRTLFKSKSRVLRLQVSSYFGIEYVQPLTLCCLAYHILQKTTYK